MSTFLPDSFDSWLTRGPREVKIPDEPQEGEECAFCGCDYDASDLEKENFILDEDIWIYKHKQCPRD